MSQGRSDEATFRSLDDQERIAALKRDVPTLKRLWSDRFTVNAPDNEVLIGKPAVLDWVHRGLINFCPRLGRPCGDASRTSGGRKGARGA